MNFRLGLEALAQFLCYFVIFVTMAAMTREETGIHFSSTFIIISTLACLIGLAQSFLTIPSITFLVSEQRQTISTFGNATYFAGFLILMLPLLSSQSIQRKKLSIRNILLCGLILATVALLIRTEARSAWAGIVVGGSLFILLVGKRKSRRRVLVIALGVVIVFTAVFHNIIFTRLNSLLELNSSSSVARRFYFYGGAWKAFLNSPIIGNGIGNFVAFLPKFRSPEYWMVRAEDIVPHAHNEFLEILSETGVAGFLCFLVIIVSYFIACWGVIRNNQDSPHLELYGYACSIVAILVDNIASLNLRTTPVAVVFWAILGLSVPHLPLKSYSIAIKLRPGLRRLNWILPLMMGLFLLWYIPYIADRYQAEKKLLEGIIARWQSQLDVSIGSFKEALMLDPNIPEARLYLAADLVQNARYKEALDHDRMLLQTYPYYPKARIVLAICSFELGDTSGAMNAIRQELEIGNSPQALYYASYFASRIGDTTLEYQYLISLFKQNLRSGIPDYAVEGLRQLDPLLNPQTYTSEMKALLSELQQNFSTHIEILTEIIECYQHLGLLPEARAALDQTFSLHPSDQAIMERLRKLRSALNPDQHHEAH
ncbi:MAG: O-antigen ligase family protein [Ignavibacteriales bacterium]|nr:O-antigen ligase family protein [Ignavibacteriales bacterium]